MNTEDSISIVPISQGVFWAWVGLIAFATTMVFAFASRNALERSSVRSWPLAICIGTYIFCCAMAVVAALFSQKLEVQAVKLARPTIPAAISADWRADLEPPERTRLTKTLARSIYINSGTIASYIGADQSLALFDPNEADKRERARFTQKIEWTASFALQASVASLIWLLVPLCGFLISMVLRRRQKQ